MADLSNSRKPSVCECGNHAWATLTKGYVTLVDVADAWALEEPHHMAPSKGKPYARSANCEYLHRKVVEAGNSIVDHENGNSLDNRRGNLRVCTNSQNLMNMGKQKKPCSSRFKGVSAYRGKWKAAIRVASRTQWLGTFHDEVDAARAYDHAAVSHFGDFARTNADLGLLLTPTPSQAAKVA